MNYNKMRKYQLWRIAIDCFVNYNQETLHILFNNGISQKQRNLDAFNLSKLFVSHNFL